MNIHAPSSAYPAADHWSQASPPLAEFARAGTAHRKTRVAGIIAVLAVHGLVLTAYVLAGPAYVRTQTQHLLTVVNVLAEPSKPEEPPPLPRFAPPVVYAAVPIVPEIQLALPPAPGETIIVPPAPAASPPDAPLVTAGPPAPPPPPKPTLSASDQAAFAERLFAHLNRFKRYPEGAKLHHQEGIVSLHFTMDRNGRVLSFEIAKSSGSAALDAEARELIQRAQPLPALPTQFSRETLDLVMPVEFSLH